MKGNITLKDIKREFDNLTSYQPYFERHGSTANFDMFMQTWPSTSLGFGGCGGDMLTEAFTIVVPRQDASDVFFGGKYAYTVPNNTSDEQKANFRVDVNENKSMVSVSEAKLKYGAFVDPYVSGN